MKRINVVSIEDLDTPRAKFTDILLKGRMCRMREVSEWQRDYGKLLPDSFDQNAQRKRVTYSICPLIDGIESCRSNDNSVWRR